MGGGWGAKDDLAYARGPRAEAVAASASALISQGGEIGYTWAAGCDEPLMATCTGVVECTSLVHWGRYEHYGCVVGTRDVVGSRVLRAARAIGGCRHTGPLSCCITLVGLRPTSLILLLTPARTQTALLRPLSSEMGVRRRVGGGRALGRQPASAGP